MCYFNRLIVPVSHAFDIGDYRLHLPDQLAWENPMRSGFEYGDWPIIVWSAMDRRPVMQIAHWEFLSPWSRTRQELEASREKYNTLNAVGENMLESRLYKDAALKRRCLVPSSGFFEWRHWKPKGAKKDLAFPYFIYLPDRPVFYIAGIWQSWTDQETGEMLTGFAIVTTAANELMEQVHNKKKRMPLILDERLALEWISPGASPDRINEMVRTGYEAQKMKAYTIQKDFRTALDPVLAQEYPDLPELVNLCS